MATRVSNPRIIGLLAGMLLGCASTDDVGRPSPTGTNTSVRTDANGKPVGELFPVPARESDGLLPGQDPRDTPAYVALEHFLARGEGEASSRPFYSALVVPNTPIGDALISAFPNHSPPLSNTIRVDTRPGHAINAATGESVQLWSTESGAVAGDQASVSVTWYTGVLAAAEYSVEVRRVSGRWQFLREKLNWIS